MGLLLVKGIVAGYQQDTQKLAENRALPDCIAGLVLLYRGAYC